MDKKVLRFSDIRAIRKNYWYSIIALLFGVAIFSQFFLFTETENVRWVIVLASFLVTFSGCMSYNKLQIMMKTRLELTCDGIAVFSPKKNFNNSWEDVKEISVKAWYEKSGFITHAKSKTVKLGKQVTIKTASGNFSFGVMEGQPKTSGYGLIESFLADMLEIAPKDKVNIEKCLDVQVEDSDESDGGSGSEAGDSSNEGK